MAEPMRAIPQSHRDLLETHFATLATVGRDGRPQLSEVFFLFEDGNVRISLNATRGKTHNLQRNRAASIFILDLINPHRYIEFRGDADIAPDDDYVFAGRVGAKYKTDLHNMDKPGESRVIVTINPVKIRAVGG